ncbi:5-formyltetrahydrofolate cyclo-ligase [Phytohabitans sp. LJ34]|uniref:5-formyltetrahydrofolate cyclo-ligase n=1 Tax=Phytohabitans sp. LJ34 TaxID=3452217 RepID=UPI003F8AB47A
MAEHADTLIAKHRIRERVWNLLIREGVSPVSAVRGKIPYFAGAEAAAQRLADTPQWHASRTIKANPDWPQLPVRVGALTAGKTVYMAVPQLADIRPFFRLDPTHLQIPLDQAAIPQAAARAAPKVHVDEMPHIDLIICGSVAVNPDGTRIGKGAGYSDIEVALLAQAGLLAPSTVIATTVHQLQVVNEALPVARHDFTVDLIVTPEQLIECPPSRHPDGLLWQDLAAEKIAAIPLLADLAGRRQTKDTGPEMAG